jgi:D-alanine-D-alanine ligase
MDKSVMKSLFRAKGLRVAESVTVLRPAWLADRAGVSASIERTLGYPLFVKPANLGSSVGISKVKTASELGPAMDLAASYDRKVIIEAAVGGAREIECAVLGNDAPEPRRLADHTVARVLRLRSEISRQRVAHRDSGAPPTRRERSAAPRGRGVRDRRSGARASISCRQPSGTLFVNEINTMPGFTTISMFAKLWRRAASIIRRSSIA